MKKITLKEIIEKLNLKLVTGSLESASKIHITKRGINKGGLELTGFFYPGDKNKFLIFGSKEINYLKQMSEPKIKKAFTNIFKQKIPALVFTNNVRIPVLIQKIAKVNNFHILKSKSGYTDTSFQIAHYLNEKLSKVEQVHGTLLQVYGKGILITGKSGVGKSETALELVKKGHLFVVDDGTQVRRNGANLYGYSPKTIQNLLEVRGIGIVDISKLLGSSFILESAKIDYVLNLKDYSSTAKFDRLGSQKKIRKILGLEIPVVDIPISAARNTSSLIEVAVSQLIVKGKGFDPLSTYRKNMEDK